MPRTRIIFLASGIQFRLRSIGLALRAAKLLSVHGLRPPSGFAILAGSPTRFLSVGPTGQATVGTRPSAAFRTCNFCRVPHAFSSRCALLPCPSPVLSVGGLLDLLICPLLPV